MKINVALIVRDHLRTLKNVSSQSLSYTDVITFFIVPILFAFISFYYSLKVKIDFYNVSIIFFGIFIALLLNIQVAIFGIFLRKWDLSAEGKSLEIIKNKLEQRKVLLGEINSNVSYLILLSCVALVFFLVAYMWCYFQGIVPAIAILLYAHFLLTLLMVIKRMHAVFQKEYD